MNTASCNTASPTAAGWPKTRAHRNGRRTSGNQSPRSPSARRRSGPTHQHRKYSGESGPSVEEFVAFKHANERNENNRALSRSGHYSKASAATTRRSEGKRANVKWIIHVDTPRGHAPKRLKIVKGMETFEEADNELQQKHLQQRIQCRTNQQAWLHEVMKIASNNRYTKPPTLTKLPSHVSATSGEDIPYNGPPLDFVANAIMATTSGLTDDFSEMNEQIPIKSALKAPPLKSAMKHYSPTQRQESPQRQSSPQRYASPQRRASPQRKSSYEFTSPEHKGPQRRSSNYSMAPSRTPSKSSHDSTTRELNRSRGEPNPRELVAVARKLSATSSGLLDIASDAIANQIAEAAAAVTSSHHQPTQSGQQSPMQSRQQSPMRSRQQSPMRSPNKRNMNTSTPSSKLETDPSELADANHVEGVEQKATSSGRQSPLRSPNMRTKSSPSPSPGKAAAHPGTLVDSSNIPVERSEPELQTPRRRQVGRAISEITIPSPLVTMASPSVSKDSSDLKSAAGSVESQPPPISYPSALMNSNSNSNNHTPPAQPKRAPSSEPLEHMPPALPQRTPSAASQQTSITDDETIQDSGHLPMSNLEDQDWNQTGSSFASSYNISEATSNDTGKNSQSANNRQPRHPQRGRLSPVQDEPPQLEEYDDNGDKNGDDDDDDEQSIDPLQNFEPYDDESIDPMVGFAPRIPEGSFAGLEKSRAFDHDDDDEEEEDEEEEYSGDESHPDDEACSDMDEDIESRMDVSLEDADQREDSSQQQKEWNRDSSNIEIVPDVPTEMLPQHYQTKSARPDSRAANDDSRTSCPGHSSAKNFNASLSSLPEDEELSGDQMEQLEVKQATKHQPHANRDRKKEKSVQPLISQTTHSAPPPTTPGRNIPSGRIVLDPKTSPSKLPVLRASRKDSSARFAGRGLLQRTQSSMMLTKPHLQSSSIFNASTPNLNAHMPTREPFSIGLNKTAHSDNADILLQGERSQETLLHDFSSSESSSSAYSFGINHPAMKKHQSFDDVNPYQVPAALEQHVSTPFMQLNLSAQDGVQLMANEEVESKHKREIALESKSPGSLPMGLAKDFNESKDLSKEGSMDSTPRMPRRKGGGEMVRQMSRFSLRKSGHDKNKKSSSKGMKNFLSFANSSLGNLSSGDLSMKLDDDSMSDEGA